MYPFQLCNWLTSFHKTQHNHCAVGGLLRTALLFPAISNITMVDAQTCDIGETLVSLTLQSSNYICQCIHVLEKYSVLIPFCRMSNNMLAMQIFSLVFGLVTKTNEAYIGAWHVKLV
jgi:hypothetical protein